MFSRSLTGTSRQASLATTQKRWRPSGRKTSYAGQRVQYQPLEDSAILRVRTVEETTDGVTAAPSISHRDVVGIVDEADADAPSSAGRVVEEGYVNDENDDAATTTFNRSNSNFKAVGVAYRPGQRAGQAEDRFDHPVRVIMFSELKE